jgi:hypothetical protein
MRPIGLEEASMIPIHGGKKGFFQCKGSHFKVQLIFEFLLPGTEILWL